MLVDVLLELTELTTLSWAVIIGITTEVAEFHRAMEARSVWSATSTTHCHDVELSFLSPAKNHL
jgi:hypothetical protein